LADAPKASVVKFGGPWWALSGGAVGLGGFEGLSDHFIQLVSELLWLFDYVVVKAEVLVLVEDFISAKWEYILSTNLVTSGLDVETKRRSGLAKRDVPCPKESFRRKSTKRAR
jgi:hypothetical protein